MMPMGGAPLLRRSTEIRTHRLKSTTGRPPSRLFIPHRFSLFRKMKMHVLLLLMALPLWQIVRQASLLLLYHHHQSLHRERNHTPFGIIIEEKQQDWMSSVSVDTKNNNNGSSSISKRRDDTAADGRRRRLLRFDWTNLELKSTMAQRMAAHQSNSCSTNNMGVGEFKFRNRFGLGSDLHLWTIALCNAMEQNVRLHTILPWIFWDQENCKQQQQQSNNITTFDTTISDPASAISSSSPTISSMSCYFPQAEPLCHLQHQQQQPRQQRHGHLLSQNITVYKKLYRGQGRINMECPTVIQDMMELSSSSAMNQLSAAGIEFLFSRVSPLVQQEAERQLHLVFSKGQQNMNHRHDATMMTMTTTSTNSTRTTRDHGSSSYNLMKNNSKRNMASTASLKQQNTIVSIPSDLITVHIRWGDKGTEMKLVPIEEYISAVHQIQRDRGRPIDKASIFLATEDPRAVKEMLSRAPALGWTIYIDQYFHDYYAWQHHQQQQQSSNNQENNVDYVVVYNGNPIMSKALQGKPGLMALGSLLVAMEANDFVLTTHSNWSRLMNEIRTNILDPRCNNCTKMIDLRPRDEMR